MKTRITYLTTIVAMLLTATLTASAQTINIIGKVEDDFLKEGLRAAVTLHNADSTFVDSATVVPFFSGGGKILWTSYYVAVPAVPKDYLVKAALDGYGDVWQRVSVTDTKAKEVQAPMLGMKRMRTINLEGVTVTATKIKMVYKGDTIVYNADAFKLPDGSMLDDLIRQLEGVTMNEAGEIFVNGKKIDELLLGSRSFMRGNQKVLMENLPYYTVKDIKVYDKRSDRDEALGTTMDRKRYVMDVNLKKEYQSGHFGNVEAAAGTEDRWLERGFVLGFTEGLRYSVMANANNVNESRHIGQQGHWSPANMPREMLTTRSVKGELDYKSQNKKVQDILDVEYTSSSSHGDTRQRKELFLAGRTPWSNSQSVSNNDNWRMGVENGLILSSFKSLFALINTGFDYAKRNGASNTDFEQHDDSLTALQRTVGMSDGKDWTLRGNVRTSFKVGGKRNFMDIKMDGSRKHSESIGAERFVTDNRVEHSTAIRHNSTDFWSDQTDAKLSLAMSHNQEYENLLRFKIENTLAYNRNRTHDWLYHPDTTYISLKDILPSRLATPPLGGMGGFDPSNSYDSRYTTVRNTLKLEYTRWYVWELMPGYTTGWPMLEAGVNLPLQSQRLDYQRGALDTLAHQTRLLVEPYLNYHYPIFKGDIAINANLSASAPDLGDRISYSDTRSPLVVRLGNPDLKSRLVSHLKIHYNGVFHKLKFFATKPNKAEWHVGAEGHYRHRDVAQSVVYNPSSGVYTYRPENVSGAYDMNTYYGLDLGLDKQRIFLWHINGEAGYVHSVDHAMLSGQTASRENTVNTTRLFNNTYLQYDKNGLNVRLSGSLNWRHSASGSQSLASLGRDGGGLDILDCQYGLSARYTLPVLKTTISADANMYTRSGYGSTDLNTSEFLVNASLSQSLMKGKLIARIEVFDLLHRLSNMQVEVNAQGRTETWYRSLPHYVMAHLVYHWNKNPKKR